MSINGTSVIYEFTYHLGIVYAKLATKQKLHGVPTYLPNLEALCLEHVWNTRSATTTSNPRPRPLGGRKYIPMSREDS
jgi:hypothetical protein